MPGTHGVFRGQILFTLALFVRHKLAPGEHGRAAGMPLPAHTPESFTLPMKSAFQP